MNEVAKRGIGYGLLATLMMTVLMVIGTIAGVSPMPAPIPIALARWVLGDVPQPALLVSGMLAHFLYGGVAGAVFALVLKNRAGLWLGIGYGVGLWLIMQIVFLPLLGWGVFGTAITPRIAAATLVLHLIYGGILGWGMRRRASATPTRLD